jgi:polyisoprenoid-binding protein YceI
MPHLRSIRWLWCLAAILLPAVVLAAGDGYRYDTEHSQILFSVSHNGYSRSFGRLHIAKGWIRFNPGDWSTAGTELDIDMTGLDMGDADWSKAVCKTSLLDCAKYPFAHFVSSGVERKDDHHGVLHGQLTLHGVTVPLSLPFTFNRAAKTIYGLHSVAGFSAALDLDRNTFGITANAGSIGEHVSVWLELEAIGDDNAIPPGKGQP